MQSSLLFIRQLNARCIYLTGLTTANALFSHPCIALLVLLFCCSVVQLVLCAAETTIYSYCIVPYPLISDSSAITLTPVYQNYYLTHAFFFILRRHSNDSQNCILLSFWEVGLLFFLLANCTATHYDAATAAILAVVPSLFVTWVHSTKYERNHVKRRNEKKGHSSQNYVLPWHTVHLYLQK